MKKIGLILLWGARWTSLTHGIYWLMFNHIKTKLILVVYFALFIPCSTARVILGPPNHINRYSIKNDVKFGK